MNTSPKPLGHPNMNVYDTLVLNVVLSVNSGSFAYIFNAFWRIRQIIGKFVVEE